MYDQYLHRFQSVRSDGWHGKRIQYDVDTDLQEAGMAWMSANPRPFLGVCGGGAEQGSETFWDVTDTLGFQPELRNPLSYWKVERALHIQGIVQSQIWITEAPCAWNWIKGPVLNTHSPPKLINEADRQESPPVEDSKAVCSMIAYHGHLYI